MINKIDIIITTMDRYDRLELLLNSIYKFYPEAKVTIADQSKDYNEEFYNNLVNTRWNIVKNKTESCMVITHHNYKEYTPNNNLTNIIKLPHDCGLSYARNYLVKHTDKPYILLLEDDFLFTEDTKIEKLYELMDVSDIAGGGVYQNDIRIPFEFNFKENGDTLEQVSDGDEYINLITKMKLEAISEKGLKQSYKELVKYKQTQCILNFFLAKRLVFNDILWYDKLKLAEHQHFFYRLSRETDYKVVYTPDVKIIDNKDHQSPHYTALRTRQEFFAESIRDLGFKRLKYLNGRVAEVNGDNIKYYYEKQSENN